jgi:IS4 transposase
MKFQSIRHTIASYRNRWGIETTFRVLKQDFRIKTTSKHQSVRLMCWFFSMLFYNIWQIAKFFISNTIKAKSFFETLRFGLKIKFKLKYHYEEKILDFFDLS